MNFKSYIKLLQMRKSATFLIVSAYFVFACPPTLGCPSVLYCPPTLGYASTLYCPPTLG